MSPPRRAADGRGIAAMTIGDLVLYQGRAYYLRGLDPMSVSNRQALLEDAQTGEEVSVPADDVEAASNGV
jgi:hypothetical protein